MPALARTEDFAEVLAQPDVVETCELGSRVGVMAFHGGALEVMTDVIATEVAERTDASLYTVVQPPGLQLHFPSTCVDPDSSPPLATFLDHVDVVITVHGFGRRGMFGSLLLGGGNRTFAEHVGANLRDQLPAYDVRTDIDTIPSKLRGLHPANPVNLPAGGGVQIELPPRVRGSSPLWWDWEGPGLTPHTTALIDGISSAVERWDI